MNIFAKIASAAIGVMAAIAFSAASAALSISIPSGATALSTGNPVILGNDNLKPGAFTEEGTFNVGAVSVDKARGAIDVRFSGGNPAGIKNMTVTFKIAGLADQVFKVTNAEGVQTLTQFALKILPNTPVKVVVSGTVFENSGQNANYDMVVSADPVPLPAAGVFLLTGLAGAAGLRLRKKAA